MLEVHVNEKGINRFRIAEPTGWVSEKAGNGAVVLELIPGSDSSAAVTKSESDTAATTTQNDAGAAAVAATDAAGAAMVVAAAAAPDMNLVLKEKAISTENTLPPHLRIEKLQAELTASNVRNVELEAKVNSLDENIGEAAAKMIGMQARIDELLQAKAVMEAKVAEFAAAVDREDQFDTAAAASPCAGEGDELSVPPPQAEEPAPEV